MCRMIVVGKSQGIERALTFPSLKLGEEMTKNEQPNDPANLLMKTYYELVEKMPRAKIQLSLQVPCDDPDCCLLLADGKKAGNA